MHNVENSWIFGCEEMSGAIAISPRMRSRCSSGPTASTRHAVLRAGICMQNALIVVNMHLPTTWQGYHEVAQALTTIEEMLEDTTAEFEKSDIIITGDYNHILDRQRAWQTVTGVISEEPVTTGKKGPDRARHAPR